MHIGDLEKFLFIVQEGSLTKAAQKISLSQPALTKIVAKLENEFNTNLFDKAKLPWKLTPAGMFFAENARKIIALKDELKQGMVSFSHDSFYRLRLGTMSLEENYLLPKIIPTFVKEQQKVKIDMFTGFPKNLTDFLLYNEVDIALTVLPLDTEEIEYIPLKTYNILVAIPINHKLAKGYTFPKDKKSLPEIDLALLKEDTLFLLKPDYCLRKMTLDACIKAGFAVKNYIEIYKTAIAHSYISSGHGYTFVFDIMTETHKDEVAYFKVKNQTLTQELVFAYKKGKKLNEIEKSFLQTLQSKIKK